MAVSWWLQNFHAILRLLRAVVPWGPIRVRDDIMPFHFSAFSRELINFYICEILSQQCPVEWRGRAIELKCSSAAASTQQNPTWTKKKTIMANATRQESEAANFHRFSGITHFVAQLSAPHFRRQQRNSGCKKYSCKINLFFALENGFSRIR